MSATKKLSDHIDAKVNPPIVFLPLMTKPAPVEKGTKYLPEVWKPT